MWYKANQFTVLDQRRIMQYVFIDVACFVIHAVWMVLFLYEGIFLLGGLNAASCLVYIYLYNAIRKAHTMKIILIFNSEVVLHSIMALICLGFTGGFELYILNFIPVMFFYSFVYADGNRLLSIFGVADGLVYVLLKVIMYFVKPRYVISDTGVAVGILIFNCVMCISSLLIITYITCKEINHTHSQLEEKNRTLTFLSCHDPLTKLLNRRSMEEIINRIEMQACETTLNAVAFFDVDNFKSFNDQYGHECGDVVLIEVAEVISSSIESRMGYVNLKENYICRWGGEEIVILFHDCEKEAVLHKVMEIKEAVGKLQLDYGKGNFSISVTCGLAFDTGSKGLRELINLADAYMLKGKKQGKDCIIQE